MDNQQELVVVSALWIVLAACGLGSLFFWAKAAVDGRMRSFVRAAALGVIASCAAIALRFLTA